MSEEWASGTVEEKTERRLRASRALAAPELDGYEIIAYMGEGTYGDVWEARDKSKTRVAIKRFRRALCKQSCDEVEMLRALDDARGIVKIKDAHLKCEPYCYVMEYMRGGTLRQLMESQGGKLPFAKAWSIFQQLTEALAYVHANGAVHCDVKPENILLDSLGRARLSDFGQARSQHGRSLGTLFYMPPEQARYETPDPQSDIYALGALLYEMVTGERPRFDADLAAELNTRSQSTQEMKDRLNKYARHLESAPDPVAHRQVREVDSDAAKTIERCLAIDLDARPKDAAAVREMIRERTSKQRRRPLLIVCGIVLPAAIALSVLGMLAAGIMALRSVKSNWEKEVVADNKSIATAISLAMKERFDERIDAISRDGRRMDWIEAMAKIEDTNATEALWKKSGDGGDNAVRPMDEAARQSIDEFWGLLRRTLKEGGDFERWSFTAANGASLGNCGHFDSQEVEVDPTTFGGDFSWRGYFNAGRDREDAKQSGHPSQRAAREARDLLRERAKSKLIQYLAPPYFRKTKDKDKQRWALSLSSVMVREGEPVGVVSGQVDWEKFNGWIGEFERASNHRKVIVANELGQTMYHPRIAQNVDDKKEFEIPTIKLDDEPFFENAFADPSARHDFSQEFKTYKDPWFAHEDSTEYLVGSALGELKNGQKLAVFVMEDEGAALLGFQNARLYSLLVFLIPSLVAVGAIVGNRFLYLTLSREASHDDA